MQCVSVTSAQGEPVVVDSAVSLDLVLPLVHPPHPDL